MRRFFVNEEIEDKIVLTEENHRHLSLVLRAKKNESIVLCNGDGFDYLAQIEDIKSTQTFLKIISKERNSAEPQTKVTLFFAPLKGDKNELIAQKATELGIFELVPVMTQNVTVKRESVKTDRLNKITLESCKQCGRATAVTVREPVALSEAVKEFGRFDTVVFPYEVKENCTTDIKTFLSKGNLGEKVAVIIGSEGGFTESEAGQICAAGATAVTLGSRILRAETASIAVLAIVMYESGGMKE